MQVPCVCVCVCVCARVNITIIIMYVHIANSPTTWLTRAQIIAEYYSILLSSYLSKWSFSNERVNLVSIQPPLSRANLVVMVLIVPVITLTLLSSISAMGTTTAVVGTLLLGVVDLDRGREREGREREREREVNNNYWCNQVAYIVSLWYNKLNFDDLAFRGPSSINTCLTQHYTHQLNHSTFQIGTKTTLQLRVTVKGHDSTCNNTLNRLFHSWYIIVVEYTWTILRYDQYGTAWLLNLHSQTMTNMVHRYISW